MPLSYVALEWERKRELFWECQICYLHTCVLFTWRVCSGRILSPLKPQTLAGTMKLHTIETDAGMLCPWQTSYSCHVCLTGSCCYAYPLMSLKCNLPPWQTTLTLLLPLSTVTVILLLPWHEWPCCCAWKWWGCSWGQWAYCYLDESHSTCPCRQWSWQLIHPQRTRGLQHYTEVIGTSGRWLMWTPLTMIVCIDFTRVQKGPALSSKWPAPRNELWVDTVTFCVRYNSTNSQCQVHCWRRAECTSRYLEGRRRNGDGALIGHGGAHLAGTLCIQPINAVALMAAVSTTHRQRQMLIWREGVCCTIKS